MKNSRRLAFGVFLALAGAGTFWVSSQLGSPAASTMPVKEAFSVSQASKLSVKPAPVAPDLLAAYTFAPSPVGEELAQMQAMLPLGAYDVRYVRVDGALFSAKASPIWLPKGQGHFALPLADGRVLQARVESSRMLDAQRFEVLASIEGQNAGRIIVAGSEIGQYSMEITEDLPSGPRTHVLNATGGELMQLYTVDPTKAPPCGTDMLPASGPLSTLSSKGAEHSHAMTASDRVTDAYTADQWYAAADSSASATCVDVYFLASQSIYDGLFGLEAQRLAAIQSRVDTIVAASNAAYIRSKIDMKIRSVAWDLVNYNEFQSGVTSSTLNSTALNQVVQFDDGVLDSVHDRRNELGADLVCLMLKRGDSTSIGIAPLLDSPSVLSTSGSLTNDVYGFSVVTYSYTTGYDLVAHEMGHNLGAQHDRDNAVGYDDQGNAVSQTGAFSFSYGYRFKGSDNKTYRTIMAYDPGTRVSYFSNPDVIAAESYLNVSVGVSESAALPCNNAHTLNDTCFEVAQYRVQRQDPIARGQMLNVSTRGFVGAGDQQMTAGFSIQGNTGENKEVLIRASGPSLSQFPGLSGLISDPWIEVTKVPDLVVMGSVDNWVDAANASDITAASSRVYAFNFTSNLDAAMLVSLAPGMYTAKVEGVGGGTGIGLVEVYDADSSATSKLVNVSTRAYASVSQTLVGGFVVQGNAGETKRILVRVQGPTLANYNVSGVMNDPVMELHRVGSSPKFLMANDDWTNSVGQSSDTSPTAYFGDEKAIAATGFAPSNRREPAMLLDLEPGQYTVTVKPFESLPSQPSSPGVALIEVFEISTQ